MNASQPVSESSRTPFTVKEKREVNQRTLTLCETCSLPTLRVAALFSLLSPRADVVQYHCTNCERDTYSIANYLPK